MEINVQSILVAKYAYTYTRICLLFSVAFSIPLHSAKNKCTEGYKYKY